MMSQERGGRWRFWWIFAVLAIILAAVLATIFIGNKVSSPSPEASNVVPKASLITDVSSNILFTGNVYWGRYINDWSMASPLKYTYPFSRLSEFNREKYNAWISGLECPLVSGVNLTSAEEDSTLSFNCSPEYLPEAAKWFTAFTLANNHTDNQGAEGFTETKQHLEANSIQYFGHYDYKNVDDVCEVISLPVSVVKNDKTTTNGNLPVAMCGFHGVFGIPVADAVAQISKYSAYMPVIAMPHMGAEYKASSDDIKINFYRSLIDAGADMVIGDHPHWIQNTESYKGHLIVYSMGNFIFDQQDTTEVTRSAAINVLMAVKTVDSTAIQKWLTIGDSCKSFKDDCLEKIKSQALSKLDISYKFGAIGSNDSGKINKPASLDQQTSILQRLDWQSTMVKLQPPYSSL